MGNTKVLCTISGPLELKRVGVAPGAAGNEARIEVEIGIAGFAGVDRARRTKGDRRTAELQYTIASAFEEVVRTELFPHSTICINLHVLALDGGLLGALVNAATLALVDAGIPMTDYLVACSAGVLASTTISSKAAPKAPRIPGLSIAAGVDDVDDPLLDLSGLEEQDVPFLTVGIVGDGKVSICICETRVEMGRVEEMVAVGIDGCKAIKRILDGVVREHGRKMLQEG